jgi:NDP-sugar pyrophosphorylase family protein
MSTLNINDFISQFTNLFPAWANKMPWEITNALYEILNARLEEPGSSFIIKNGIVIHKTAVIEANVTVKAPAVIGAKCFIGANAYLREGVFLADNVRIGPGCEIKQSIIFSGTAIAHFNYVGNSIIGTNVNMEAGAVIANHYNERKDKTISVLLNGMPISTNTEKFGALVGDNARIGANAVLSPGTLLAPGTIVKRLELVEQVV